ncbi:hypothetical protein N7466_004809 [Penicillium verhagenii]|uniref:uncharacterized protein n=1 Tax=Penicillium verhagenii TaxID=1562060 RepID=UPI002544DDB0|nr:uncharacterized protein N7466_004809 [Penicillium verhagenii]KAJ5935262.1 hypothetical protein N7466_004809 [Penicillium verhagenii]
MHHLSRPTFSFSIPSIHDGRQLECHVYLPRHLENIESTAPNNIQGAIFAHPYAPLGGSYDDPVVSFIGGELQNAGFVVGTFNFRGAGGSEGQTSWTGKPELGDYTSFYGFMLHYLHALKSTQGSRVEGDRDRGIDLILGGYSYGSMIASHAPTLDVMIDLFKPGPGVGTTVSPDTPIDRIGREARKIAAATIPGYVAARPQGRDDEGFHASTLISYLLVSPLLFPVSSFLTVFTTLSVNVGDRSAQARPARPADQLSVHRTLALFGDDDTFTSVGKLRRWSAELGRMPHSQFRGCEIENAGHFWREDGVEQEAREILREWLRGYAFDE